MTIWLRGAATLAVALLALPVAAQTSKESPGRITPTAATSACIGGAATPNCAAETFLACLTRGDMTLCRAVNAAVPQRAAGEPIQTEYVLERSSLIRPEDVTEDLRDVEWFKPGFALVEAQRRVCPADIASCADESWEDLQVYLRRRDDAATVAWDVIHWRSDSEPDMAPELPDDFTRKPAP